MKQQSRTVTRRRQSESPSVRHLPGRDLMDTEAELQELVVASGLKRPRRGSTSSTRFGARVRRWVVRRPVTRQFRTRCGSGRFVAQTQAQLDAWRATPLDNSTWPYC